MSGQRREPDLHETQLPGAHQKPEAQPLALAPGGLQEALTRGIQPVGHRRPRVL